MRFKKGDIVGYHGPTWPESKATVLSYDGPNHVCILFEDGKDWWTHSANLSILKLHSGVVRI